MYQFLPSLGDYNGTIWAFRSGIEKNPSDPWFRKILGDAYMGTKDYKAASEACQAAIEMSPTDSRF